MLNIIIFGAGCLLGVLAMCLLQINRINDKNEIPHGEDAERAKNGKIEIERTIK